MHDYGGVRSQFIHLDTSEVDQLLRSEEAGQFKFVLPGPLEPPPTEASPH
ncbi:MAG TPA: hypothetical protein VGA56_16815 [Opitutaceae bacterium]